MYWWSRIKHVLAQLAGHQTAYICSYLLQKCIDIKHFKFPSDTKISWISERISFSERPLIQLNKKMRSKSVSGEFCIYKEIALELNKNFVNFYDSFCWIIDAFVIVIIKANSILYTPNCKLKTVDKLYSMYKRLTTK